MSKFHLNWVIEQVSKDDEGIVVELARLDETRRMIVVTDTKFPISEGSYRQVGYGPYIGENIDIEIINQLKTALIERRPH